MNRSAPSASAASPLAPLLDELEAALQGVQQALSSRDSRLLEQQASQVQRLMASALAQSRGQPLAAPLRRQLARASALLAAERQALGRATAMLDRAIDVLMPAEPDPSGVYGTSGRALRQRSSLGGGLSA